jgi:hypothetical protein
MWLAGAALAVACSSSVWAEQAQSIASRTELSVSPVHATGASKGATFSVHVSVIGGDAHPGGVVTLVEGAREIGSGVLNADSDATVESSSLLPGLHSVRALYSGSGNVRASVSEEADVTADATADATGTPTFTATSNPTTLTVVQGDSVTATVTLTPENGFNNYVSLSCTNLPLDTTCTFLPANVFVSGTAATTSVLTIETYGATGPDAKLGKDSPLVFACVFPGLLALAGLGLRRTGWRNRITMFLMLAGLGLTLGAMSGCSQRYFYLNRPPVASPGTALGSTPFVIEAQAVSGVVVTTVNITNVVLTVQAPPS